MNYSLEPRNGRGLPVEGLVGDPEKQEPSAGEIRVGLGRPYFLGSRPCTRGEFDIYVDVVMRIRVSSLYTGGVCYGQGEMVKEFGLVPVHGGSLIRDPVTGYWHSSRPCTRGEFATEGWPGAVQGVSSLYTGGSLFAQE